MGAQHTVLTDGQPPTVAFTVLACLHSCVAHRQMKQREVLPYSPRMLREGFCQFLTKNSDEDDSCEIDTEHDLKQKRQKIKWKKMVSWKEQTGGER